MQCQIAGPCGWLGFGHGVPPGDWVRASCKKAGRMIGWCFCETFYRQLYIFTFFMCVCSGLYGTKADKSLENGYVIFWVLLGLWVSLAICIILHRIWHGGPFVDSGRSSTLYKKKSKSLQTPCMRLFTHPALGLRVLMTRYQSKQKNHPRKRMGGK